MSFNNIHKLKSLFTANGGCRCRPKPEDIIQPHPKSKTSSFSDQNSGHVISSSGSSSATPFSFNIDASPRRDHDRFKTVSSCRKIEDSFAVVKDSDNPYQDFRQSMLQMILEKEIYSTNDLQQLLDCFLMMNSPHHHEVIIQAFVDIWNGSGGGGKEALPCSTAGS